MIPCSSLMQVFQQVQTGTAVNLGKIKHHMDFRSLPEAHQLTGDGCVVEKGKFVLPGYGSPADPRLLVELVIIAKAILIQKL